MEASRGLYGQRRIVVSFWTCDYKRVPPRKRGRKNGARPPTLKRLPRKGNSSNQRSRSLRTQRNYPQKGTKDSKDISLSLWCLFVANFFVFGGFATSIQLVRVSVFDGGLYLLRRLGRFDLVFEHASIRRQLGAGNLEIVQPEPRTNQRLTAMQECFTDRNHEHSPWPLSIPIPPVHHLGPGGHLRNAIHAQRLIDAWNQE